MKRFLVATVAALVLAAGATACEKGVASSVSPCYRLLPIARAALPGADKVPVDVARVRGTAMPRFGPLRRSRPTTSLPPGAPRPQRDVCVIAYHGRFVEGQIPRTYGVAVVSVRTRRVVLVRFLDHLPRPLHGH